MKALSKSTEASNMEFIVHVKDEYDYRFNCEMREELFEQLKACFFNLMNLNLPIYGVPQKLKEYATSKKDIKSGQEKLPPDSYLLRNEDVYEPLRDSAPSIGGGHGSAGLSIEDDDLPTPGMHRPTFAKRGDMDVSLSDFVIKKVIGRGSFGKVFLV